MSTRTLVIGLTLIGTFMQLAPLASALLWQTRKAPRLGFRQDLWPQRAAGP